MIPPATFARIFLKLLEKPRDIELMTKDFGEVWSTCVDSKKLFDPRKNDMPPDGTLQVMCAFWWSVVFTEAKNMSLGQLTEIKILAGDELKWVRSQTYQVGPNGQTMRYTVGPNCFMSKVNTQLDSAIAVIAAKAAAKKFLTEVAELIDTMSTELAPTAIASPQIERKGVELQALLDAFRDTCDRMGRT